MKILVLTSRYTATRDIIGENFGRQTRLFSALKKLNYEIDFFVADYRKFENKNAKLNGISVMIRPFNFFYFFDFLKDLNSALKNKKYDAVIASSDPLWGIIGYYFSKKHSIKFIYDLHDNYETYESYKIPFMKQFDNYAVRNAAFVTTVSYALKEKISNVRKKDVFVIQNGINLELFKPMDKIYCRKKLNLPLKSKLIAYTGTLQKSLGVDILVSVFENLKQKIPDLKLILVGRFGADKNDDPDIKKKGVISFDALSQKDVVLAINAADVVVMPSPSNEFTKYCFPYKCAEYMACNTPIVASSLSDVTLMLKGYKGSLCKPDDKEALSRKIKVQLSKGRVDYRKKLKNFTWDDMAKKLDKAIKGI